MGRRLALSLCLLATTAAQVSAGEFFTPRGTQPPLDHDLLPPSDCASCHAGYDSQNHLEPWDTWAGSMMANASRDPIFWAALDVANNDYPGIGEFCLRCHSSAGWLEGRADADIVPDPPETGAADGCQLVGKIDEPGDDFTGLSCHLCHRMMVNDNAVPPEESVYFENGDFWLDDNDCPDGPSNGPCRRGPYNYPPNPAAPHEWAYSDYHVDNDICGNCHNVTNPLLNLRDESGVDLGVGFPIERTFKEWQRSEFSDDQSANFANCSACHMPDADADPAYASSRGNPERTGNLPLHQFAGGNTWIPQILKGDDFPGLDRDASLDATTVWAQDLLQNRSAMVEISADSTVGDGNSISAEIKVTNLSGHKLPTGYGEGRRMWLNFTARDGLDQLFWESGAWSPGTGDLTQDAQVKIYEVQQGIWDHSTNTCDVEDDATGKHLFHFVLNNCIALDNRIPPLGFAPVDDPEIVPVNYSYPETSPGSGILVNWDTTQYAIPVPPGTATPVTIEATLYYQTASKEYVEFLRDQAVENEFPDDCVDRNVPLPPGMSRGEYLYSLWDNPLYGRSPPVDMGSATAEVSIVPEEIFADGFESGDTTAWDSTVP